MEDGLWEAGFVETNVGWVEEEFGSFEAFVGEREVVFSGPGEGSKGAFVGGGGGRRFFGRIVGPREAGFDGVVVREDVV